MKKELLDAIDNLENFLVSIDGINKHPYSKGIDVEKLIKDLKDYASDLKDMVEKIEEVTTDAEGQPEENN